MKTKEKTRLWSMNDVELVKELGELRDKLVKFTINRYTKPSKNVREGRGLRRKITMILSLLTSKKKENTV